MSPSDGATVQYMVLSVMAQDFYVLLAKKSIFGNLLNVLNLIQLRLRLSFSLRYFIFGLANRPRKFASGVPHSSAFHSYLIVGGLFWDGGWRG